MDGLRGGLMEMNCNGGCWGLLRLKAVASRLGVSVRTVYRIIAEGGLRLVHVRGCACIEESELQNYIERSKGVKNHD
jgi:excisionase family DNA binding protein